MPKFKESVKISEFQTQEKHKAEMEELRKRQEIEFEKIKQHPPSEILNLRKRVETFASAGEYAEAKKVKSQLFELENEWLRKTEEKLKEKWEEQTEKMIDKHEKEKKSNLIKFKKQEELKEIQFNKDKEILAKRYNNVKSDLLNQQKIEKQKLIKEFSVKRQAMESISSKTKKTRN